MDPGSDTSCRPGWRIESLADGVNTPQSNVAGVVLAGGLSRRMGGGDKALLDVAGQPMLERVIDRLRPQVSSLVLNANGDAARFSQFGLPVVADPVEGFAGPLAGVLAGLRWASSFARAQDPGAKPVSTFAEPAPDATIPQYVVSVAGDTPFFPRDLVARLLDVADGRDRIVLAESDGRVHPVFGLWPVAFAGDLDAFLTAGETRKVLAFVDRHDNARVEFPLTEGAGGAVDPFFNVNTPEEMAIAEALAHAGA